MIRADLDAEIIRALNEAGDEQREQANEERALTAIRTRQDEGTGMTWQTVGNVQRWIGEPMNEPPVHELAWYRTDFGGNCVDCGIPKPASAEHTRCRPCGNRAKAKP